MRAVKGNKEYTIGETEQKSYQDSGFDIVGDDGNIIAYGRGKTVPFEDYMVALKEIEQLKAQLNETDSEQAAASAQNEKRTANKKAGE